MQTGVGVAHAELKHGGFRVQQSPGEIGEGLLAGFFFLGQDGANLRVVDALHVVLLQQLEGALLIPRDVHGVGHGDVDGHRADFPILVLGDELQAAAVQLLAAGQGRRIAVFQAGKLVNSGALVHHLEVVGEALQGLFRLPKSGGVVLLDAQIPQAADAAL